jgi:HAD superfamily hydrolase (TIGR01549 family)
MRLISKYKIIFWDFDGVIKESVSVKTEAFRKLFSKFGTKVSNKVVSHHKNNGGMSRYDKIPIYLKFTHLKVTKENIEKYCNIFSKLVEDDVVNSSWVSGVERIIKKNNLNKQKFVIASATPQNEMERILKQLKIYNKFSLIFGAPNSKENAIKISLKKFNFYKEAAVMIGDSRSDYRAAKLNKIDFLLRRTPENLVSMSDYNGLTIENFLNHE